MADVLYPCVDENCPHRAFTHSHAPPTPTAPDAVEMLRGQLNAACLQRDAMLINIRRFLKTVDSNGTPLNHQAYVEAVGDLTASILRAVGAPS